MGVLGPFVAPGEFAAFGGVGADEDVEVDRVGGGGEKEIAGGDALLGLGGELFGFSVEVVEGEAAGGVDVLPTVGI